MLLRYFYEIVLVINCLIAFFLLQDAMQFYDTPRALMQEQVEIPDSNTNANYDTPQQPLPVYKKPCGCIMKLVKTGNFNCHEYFVQQGASSLDLVLP